MSDIDKLLLRVKKAEKEAHKILSKHESVVSSRVIHLDKLLIELNKLPVDIKGYFVEAVRCLEYDFRRASIIMAWSGYFQVFCQKLYKHHELDIRSLRSKWKFDDLQELKERYTESAILDVSNRIKFVSNAELRVLQGHLSTRNKCAHPTLYQPSLNYAIGYVNEVIEKTLLIIEV